MRIYLLDILKKYKDFILIFVLLAILIIFSYFSFLRSLTYGCATSPYSPFKEKYCPSDTVKITGQVRMQTYDLSLQPLITIETSVLRLVRVYDEIEIWNIDWPNIRSLSSLRYLGAGVQINTFVAYPTFLKNVVSTLLHVIGIGLWAWILAKLLRLKKWLKYPIYFYLGYLGLRLIDMLFTFFSIFYFAQFILQK